MRTPFKKHHILPDATLALKSADNILFEYKDEQTSVITCTKKTKETELEYQFEIFSSAERDDQPGVSLDIESAQFFVPWSFYNWELQTAFKRLEYMSEVELIWLPDRVIDEELASRGIFIDVLKLIIFSEDYQYHHILTTHVCTEKNRLMTFKS